MSPEKKVAQHPDMGRHILDVVPMEPTAFFPGSRGPTTSWPNPGEFLADSFPRRGIRDVERRHHAIHEPTHGPEASAMHQATLFGWKAPRRWKRVLDGIPVGQEHPLDASKVSFPRRQ